jgi:hypothetical protein
MKKKSFFVGMLAMLLTFGFVLAGCEDPNSGGGGGGGDDPTPSVPDVPSNPGSPAAFVPVTGITGVPTGATVGTDQTLSGTVAPANATNQTIAWSVYSVGTTGASTDGNKLRTTSAGTATVRATIANGLTASTNYTKDFAITVTTEFIPVTDITSVPSAATAGTDLALNGTVAPSNATNQNIAWSVTSAGATGASIVDGNKLSTTGAGAATVRATIAGGSGATSNYTRDFAVTVVAPLPTNGTLVERLAWISSYAVDGGDYTIELRADETIAPTSLSYNGKTVKITLIGDTAERTVSLGSTGSLFTIGSGVTMTLDNNVTLQGRSNNEISLVQVNAGSTLAIKGNAKITGNTVSSSSSYFYGGGVHVNGGSFTMSGSATVSGNTASNSNYGGGVHVSGGSFIMSGSTAVSGNTASSGGGVYVGGGSFTMNDNTTVYGNTASNYGGGVNVSGSGIFIIMNGNATVSGNTANYGGGVSVDGGNSFTMNGSAAVSNNTASNYGGGVSVSSGSFVMSGNATVSNNTASNYGGGVYVRSGSFVMSGSASVSSNTAGSGVFVFNGSFTMNDSATVSGNTGANGGGVCVSGNSYTTASFTMNGGSVSGNTASYNGGGVYVYYDADSFTKTGGVIYGSNETNPALRNTVKDSAGVERTGRGAAVYADPSRRETTVGAGQNMGLTSDRTYTGEWTDPPVDTTAPTLSAGSVEALSTAAGTTATLKFTSNEAGTYYYLVLAASVDVPTAATIQAQGTAVAKGSAAASASQNTVSVTGLQSGTQYKAYIVVKDAAGNVSAVLTISGVNPVVATAFVPITGISGVPSATTAGTDLTFSGTVTPVDATNQTIVWSVYSAGTTGASIVSGSTLRTTGAGTATVRATVTNGSSASSNYTQDFNVTVTPPVPSVPTGVSATAASSSSITVGWTAVTGATSYRVYRSSTSGGTYSQVGTPTSNTYSNTTCII